MSNDSKARSTVSFAGQCASRLTLRALTLRALPALLAAVLVSSSIPAAAEPVCDNTRTCCTNPGGGSPCGGAGATTQGNASGTQQGAGNPINVVTGNKYQQEVDLPALPGVLGLEVVRHYNSATSGLSSATGILGRGWKLSYETELSIKTASTLEVLQADGSIIVFSKLAQAPRAGTKRPDVDAGLAAASGSSNVTATWTSADPAQGRITARTTAQGNEYRWRWLGAGDASSAGRELLFDERGKLVQIGAPTGEFVSLRHDAQGWLVQVTDPQGRSLHLNYLDQKLAQSDREHNQRFRGLQSIDTPTGRIAYAYNDFGAQTPERVRAELAARRIDKLQLLANLVKVSLPTHYKHDQKVHAFANRGVSSSSVARLYHYEDPANPTLLTGISVSGQGSDGRQMLQRIATYGYDAYGRANLSVKGEPARLAVDASGKAIEPKRLAEGTGIEQVALSWPKAGEVALTNGLGQTTRYRTAKIAGQPRIVEVRGAGCASCGPSNVRYSYDKAGRLVEETTLSSAGEPIQTTRSERDAQSRVTRISSTAHLEVKAQSARWQRRFAYGSDPDQAQPLVITRPSVIAGQEHRIELDYNDKGQLTRVTESGFSPVDANGQPRPSGAPIRRSTTYAYQTINGRSVLAQIDGPLPNGEKATPEDSDITQVQWDARGDRIVAVTAPAGEQTRIAYDPAGRLHRVSGSAARTDTYAYDPMGRLDQSSRSQGQRDFGALAYRYDAAGRATERVAVLDGQPQPQSAQGFDAGNRLLWSADRLGVLRQARYDAESHLLASSVEGAGIRQAERYRYDGFGRLAKVEDTTGAVRRLLRDDAGRLSGVLDPLGRLTRYQRRHALHHSKHALTVTRAANTAKPLAVSYRSDASGHVVSIEATASDLRARNAGQTQHLVIRRLIDDFGREVGLIDAASGATYSRFDSADRLVQVRDAAGTEITFSYDPAGRMTERVVRAAEGEPYATRIRYSGARVVEIADPLQTERYDYDGQGQLIGKTVIRTMSGESQGKIQLTHHTRYRYDARGRLEAQTLPDGSELSYQRNGQGQIVAVERNTAPWAPFGLGRMTLVKDMERDLIGLRNMTYGNGIVARWQRSREGVLARVVYTQPEVPMPGGLRASFEALVPNAKAEPSRPQPAQTARAKQPPQSSAPGAFGLTAEPKALWDSRLVFDAAGNVVMQAQFASSAVAVPGHTGYLYDALDQLAQAARSVATADQQGVRTVAAAATAEPTGDLVDTTPTVWRYHHDSLGNRLLAQEQKWASDFDHSVENARDEHDLLGRQQSDEQRSYRWDAQGRLIGIEHGNGATVYRYNQRGERVSKQCFGGDSRSPSVVHYLYNERRQRLAELDGQGRITRQYVWLDDRLLAVIDPEQPQALKPQAIGIWQEANALIDSLWAAVAGGQAKLSYVHANHLGAPVAMTDDKARPIWSAEYAPFGKRIATGEPTLAQANAPGFVAQGGVEGIKLDLRLPGQWEDEESGLYYNDHRYYDPGQGRYLSADPLGLRGGLNAYTYVGNNPVGYSDPLGLVLFAFDGSNNSNDESWLQARGSSFSNVWEFRNLYLSGTRRYITGVGTVDRSDPERPIDPADFTPWILGLPAGLVDAAGNYSGAARIDRMIEYFNNVAENTGDDNFAMDVDIIGFSRGAAQARDFANQIVSHTRNGIYSYSATVDGQTQTRCQKVNFRFMGLWDTVLSANNGRAFDLTIPDQFAYVAQAVALNEYRDLFPLESIQQQGSYSTAPTPGVTRIERGFVGAHSDIGGGFEAAESQLAQVALAWMVKQATLAGVQMSAPASTVIANPVLHDDSRNNHIRPPGEDPPGGLENRLVRYRDGSTVRQKDMVLAGGMSYPDTEQFITYLPNWDPRRRNLVSGTVEMRGYLDWLNANGYHIGLTVP